MACIFVLQIAAPFACGLIAGANCGIGVSSTTVSELASRQRPDFVDGLIGLNPVPQKPRPVRPLPKITLDRFQTPPLGVIFGSNEPTSRVPGAHRLAGADLVLRCSE